MYLYAFYHYSNYFHTAMLQLGDNTERCPHKIVLSPNWLFVSTAPSSAGKLVAPYFFTEIL